MTDYEQIIKLSLERGFYFPSSQIYSDAPAGFWEYGPNGVNIKNKFIDLWRKEMIRKAAIVEIDGSQVMSESVFIASGHIKNFSDPIINCLGCKSTFRADKFISEKTGQEIAERLNVDDINILIKKNNLKCPKCNSDFENSSRFNMMFKLGIGPNNDEAYLRPETCQSIFVDFSRLFKVMRGKLPFGVGQVGKSFRNEIAPRQSLLRLREFYQAEIEIFFNRENVDEISGFDEIKDDILRIYYQGQYNELKVQDAIKENIIPNKLIAYYLVLLKQFYEKTGINIEKSRFRKLSDDEKAFYATTAFDFEVETSVGWLELVACNDRSDYDLSEHSKTSKQNLEVIDPQTQKKILPHVFELSMGIDRSIYTILEHSYFDDIENERTVLKLKPYLAPITVGILPLVKKNGLNEIASKIFSDVKREFDVFYDDAGSIGRRYRRLEEIGTPFAITIDHITLEDQTVTIRYRDDMTQTRIKISEIKDMINNSLKY